MYSNKTLRVLKGIVVWFFVAVAVCMMLFTILSVTTFNRADRNLFGYKPFIVLSDSMSRTDFSSGDLVFIVDVDPATLQPGDIIAYSSQNIENYGEIVTHKIRELTTDTDGSPGFITYGTTTDTDDEAVVTYPYVIGKYTGTCLRGVGTLFSFLKTTPGYICCILLPFLVLILLQGINCIRLFRRYKAEQLEELKFERERMQEEQAESKRMLQELMALKNMMASGAPPQQWPQYGNYSGQTPMQQQIPSMPMPQMQPQQMPWQQIPQQPIPSQPQQWSQYEYEYGNYAGQPMRQYMQPPMPPMPPQPQQWSPYEYENYTPPKPQRDISRQTSEFESNAEAAQEPSDVNARVGDT